MKSVKRYDCILRNLIDFGTLPFCFLGEKVFRWAEHRGSILFNKHSKYMNHIKNANSKLHAEYSAQYNRAEDITLEKERHSI